MHYHTQIYIEKSSQCKHIELLRCTFFVVHKLILSTFSWIRCTSFILIGDSRSASDFNCLFSEPVKVSDRYIYSSFIGIIEWRMMNNDIPDLLRMLDDDDGRHSYHPPSNQFTNKANKVCIAQTNILQIQLLMTR